MTAPKWTRPEPGPTARMFTNARLALSDAQHAGHTGYAALILHEAARHLTMHDLFWTVQRPPMGRHHPDFARTVTAPGKAA